MLKNTLLIFTAFNETTLSLCIFESFHVLVLDERKGSCLWFLLGQLQEEEKKKGAGKELQKVVWFWSRRTERVVGGAGLGNRKWRVDTILGYGEIEIEIQVSRKNRLDAVVHLPFTLV